MNRSWVLGLYPWWCDGFCFVWDGTRHVPMMGNRCMVFHVLLTDITLDHAQRISIDPGEAAAWGSRTKFIYDNRFQTPELSLGRWWWRGMQKTEVWFSCSVVVFGRQKKNNNNNNNTIARWRESIETLIPRRFDEKSILAILVISGNEPIGDIISDKNW